MERFCTNCGNVLEEGALFCPECGERVASPAEEKAEDMKQEFQQTLGEEAEQTPAEAEQTPAEAEQTPAEAELPKIPDYAAPAFTAAAATAAGTAAASEKPVAPAAHLSEGPEVLTVYNKPLSTAAYFWTLLLFAVPVIGLIAMLIMAFASKNANRRNLAQACLIGLLICLIFLGLFMLVLVVSGKSFGVDISKFSLKTIWEGILTGIGFTK